jgi:hypothetical protein
MVGCGFDGVGFAGWLTASVKQAASLAVITILLTADCRAALRSVSSM